MRAALPVSAAALTIAGMASAFVATLIGEASLDLYIGSATAAGAGLALMLLQLARSRTESSRNALLPMGIVVALLGVAASGASCGVACIAWGAPAAALTLAAPDLRGWLSRRTSLRRV